MFSLQIFEWWYFRKYGTSFIEQVSVSHLRPLLGGVESSSATGLFASVNGEAEPRPSVSGKYVYDDTTAILFITLLALITVCSFWQSARSGGTL